MVIWTRRRLLAAASGAAASGLLAACGGSLAPTATAAPKSQTPSTTAPQVTAAVAPTTSAPSTAATASSSVAGGVTPTVSAASSAAPAGTTGGQISMLYAKPVTFQPLFTSVGADQGVEQLIFGALVKVNDKLESVPDIAETIDISPDVKTYTFHMKKLAWTDGQPLTAKDVVFTIARAVDKRTGSYWRGRLLQIDGAAEYGDQKADTITGLTMPDDYTVKMVLKTPDATWLATLGDFAGMGILPEHVLKDVPPDQLQKQAFALNPNVTAGAFKFGGYATDQYVELQRNDAYTGGPKPKLDKIFLKILTPSVAIAQLEKGELDLMGPVPVQELDRLKKNPLLTVVSVPSPSTTKLAPNLQKPPFQDKRVRQAMTHAIDRENIVRQLLGGEARVINTTIIGPAWMGTIPGLNEYAYNPDKAKQLLKDANWDASRRYGVAYVGGDPQTDAYLAIIQQQLKDVGVGIDLRPSDTTEYTRKTVTESDFDLAIVAGGVYAQDPNVSAKYFETANFTPTGGNYSHYSNPKVDDLFKQGRTIGDLGQRKQIYTLAAQMLNDDAPWILLWSPNSIFAYNKRLQGFKPPSYATHQVWNAEEWSVTK
ncbi:MAG: ABC transporter substrate-binding protein [Chloroflexota bacterium]|nr:ABC transporter substrate-binding protein [Chloroflexota bacterium]